MSNNEIIAKILEELNIHEPAHTAAYWMAHGCHVRKGQHAAAVCRLWMPRKMSKKEQEEAAAEPGEETGAPEFVQVKSFLFLQSQVERNKKEMRVHDQVQLYGVEMDAYRHPRLVREAGIEYEHRVLDTPEKAAAFFRQAFRLGDQAEEHLCMVSLSTKMQPLAAFCVAHGGVAACPASAREIFCRALLTNASHIIVCHNHPSGDVTPSPADYDFSGNIVRAGEIIGIPVQDSLIVKKACDNISRCKLLITRTEAGVIDSSTGKRTLMVKERTKTAAGEREIIIPDRAQEIIRILKRKSFGCEFLISEKGKRLTSKQINYHLQKICKELGMKPHATHSLRRAYASMLIESNVGRALVTAQLGHTEIETTFKSYYEDLSDDYEKLSKMNEATAI